MCESFSEKSKGPGQIVWKLPSDGRWKCFKLGPRHYAVFGADKPALCFGSPVRKLPKKVHLHRVNGTEFYEAFGSGVFPKRK